MSKTVVALYRSFDSAQQAVSELLSSGIPQDRISLLRKDTNETGTSTATDSEGRSHDLDAGSGAAIGAGTGAVVGGALGAVLAGVANIAIPGLGTVLGVGPFAATVIGGAGIGALSGGVMGALVNSGVPEEHARYYTQGVSQGGTLVTVHADDTQADLASDILSRYNPLDVDSNEEFSNESAPAASSFSGTPATALADDGPTQTASNAVTPPVLPAASTDRAADIDESRRAIPIVQEDINIGKQKVEAGTARVRTRIYERPVEETVTLREEKLNVERRPTNRQLRPGEDAFREETIEVRETREEPIVNKTARVVEEVVVDKQAVEHDETVRDTVRKTDVEIDRDTSRTSERSKLGQ